MQFGDDHSRTQAYELLRGLTYLQTVSGENQGQRGALDAARRHPQPERRPSGAPIPPTRELRTGWRAPSGRLGEGYRAFRDADPAFADFLRQRLELAIDAVDRQVLTPVTARCRRLTGCNGPHG